MGIKKAPQAIMPEGLHPVSWPLCDPASVRCRTARNRSKRQAGLLAYPTLQRPSHLAEARQWHTRLPRFFFRIESRPIRRKVGFTAAGPLPILTGFPIKPDGHLNACCKYQPGFRSSRKNAAEGACRTMPTRIRGAKRIDQEVALPLEAPYRDRNSKSEKERNIAISMAYFEAAIPWIKILDAHGGGRKEGAANPKGKQ